MDPEPKEPVLTAAEYANKGKARAKMGIFISTTSAAWATYLLSGGNVGATFLVGLSVSTALIAVCNKVTFSTSALAAYILEIASARQK